MGIKLRLNSSTRQEDKKSKEDKKNKVRGKRVVSSEEVSRDKRRKAKDRKFEPPKPLATPSFTRDHSFDRRTVGEEKPYDFLHNCTTCLRWPVCGDSKKSGYYMCSRYQENTIDVSVDELEMFKAGGEEDSSAPEESEADNSFLVSASGEGEESIMNMLERVLDTNMPVPPDLRVNDSDFPKAPNFYEWATNKKFTQDGVKPFPRQIEIGFKLLGEYCPKCSDMKWFDTKVRVDTPIGIIRERVQPLVFGVCPKCKSKKSEMLGSNLMDEYYTLVGLAGQRAAKTASTVLWEGYNLHRLVTLSNPALAFGLLPTQPLIGTFAALTFNQAVENAWIPFRNVLTTSRWYTEYHDFLRSRGRELGEELFTLGENSVRYRHRNLIYSPSGPSKRVMRGRCATGSTLINMGGFQRLDEVIKHTKGTVDVADQNLTVDGPKGQRKVSHLYKDYDKTIKAVTLNGYEIEATYEHPMLVLTEDLKMVWRRMDKLRLGDWIVSVTNQNEVEFGESKITKEHAGWLGYWVANGNKDGAVYSGDPKVVKRLTKYAKHMHPAINAHISKPTGSSSKIFFSTARIGANKRTHMVPSFATLFIPTAIRGNSYSKSIPHIVRTAPKEVLHEFLECYFECDCHINGEAGEGRTSAISVSSASKTLIDQLHVILLHGYGIVGRKRHKKWTKEEYHAAGKTHGSLESMNRDTYEMHTISITGWDANEFLRCFKRAKVQGWADRYRTEKKGDHSDRRAVPYVRNIVRDILISSSTRTPKGRLSRTKTALNGDVISHTHLGSKCPVYRITEDRAQDLIPEFVMYDKDWQDHLSYLSLLDVTYPDRIKSLLELSPHLEQVTSITKGKKRKPVYDITVPKGHAFMANGLVSHNTRCMALIDEAGWFPMSSATGKEMERLDVKGVDVALGRSLFTVKTAHRRRTQEGFDGLFKPMKYLVSSPSGIQDYIMTSYRRAMGSSEIFRFKYASWEFNPLLKREDFAEEFRDKPIDAARDYECNPPAGEGLFITDTDSIEKCVSHANAFQTDTSVGLSKTKSRITKGNVSLVRKPNTPHATILAIDVGLVNNSFSFSIVTLPNECTLPPIDEYGERDYDEIDEEDDDTLMVPVKILGTGEVMPEPGTTISLTHLYKHCLIPLCEIFDVRYVVSDRWQNATISSNLEERFEIEPHEIRCRWEDFVLTRELIQQGMMELPRGEKSIKELIEQPHDNYPNMYKRKTSDHLLWQLASVREQTNVTVTKPDYGTDDAFRTVVIGASLIQNLEIAHSLYNGGGTVEEVKKSGPLAISLGYGSKQIKSGKNSLPSAGGSAGGNSSLVHSVKLTWNR